MNVTEKLQQQAAYVELQRPEPPENLALKTIRVICGAVARFAEDTLKEQEMFRDIPNMG